MPKVENLDTIDLENRVCPPNLEIEIEGHAPMNINVPNISLFLGLPMFT